MAQTKTKQNKSFLDQIEQCAKNLIKSNKNQLGLFFNIDADKFVENNIEAIAEETIRSSVNETWTANTVKLACGKVLSSLTNFEKTL